jgi:hypothetical protein
VTTVTIWVPEFLHITLPDRDSSSNRWMYHPAFERLYRALAPVAREANCAC